MDSVKDVQSVILSEEDVAMETDKKISNVSETVGDCLGAEFSNTNSKSEANDAIIESQPQDVDDTLGMKNDGEMEISEAVDIEQLVPENEIIEFAIDKKVDMEEKPIVSEISTCDTVVESLVMKKDDSPATINLTKANEIEKDETGLNLSGIRLSQEQFDLFNNAFTAINKAPLDDNSLNEIATTVFTNVTEKDLHIFCTEIGAQVLWKILGYAKPTLFQKISKMLYKNISIISKDVYAYFAMNQLIQIAFLRCATEESPEVLSPKKNKDEENDDEFDVFYYNLKKPFPNNHKKFCMDFIERVSKHLLKNLDDYIYDSSGNQLLRGCLICLSGKAKTIKDKQNSSQCIEIKAVLKMTVPQLWSRVLRSIAVRIYKMPVMLDFQNNELTTELLRTLLGSLGIGHPKFVFVYGINLLLKYFSEIDASTNLPKVFSNELSLSLMYTVLQVGDEKLMKYYYSKLFMANLTPLCTTANTKWAVEKLLETCKDKVIFADIYEKVSRMLSNLINIGNTGIIMELAKGCRRLCCRQKSFVQQMGEALNCSGENSNKFLACLLKLVPLELIAKYDDTFIHIHGAVIICEILQFKNPYKLVQSFLEMEKVDIAKIFCNPKGAFICDALMQSESIPGMIQLKFIHERLKGEYTKLAISRYGLVCLKAIFEAAPNKYRESIMEELANSFDDLNNTPSCKRIISMFNIELYKLENRLWKQKYLRKIHQNNIEMDISGEGNLLMDNHNDAEDDENDK